MNSSIVDTTKSVSHGSKYRRIPVRIGRYILVSAGTEPIPECFSVLDPAMENITILLVVLYRYIENIGLTDISAETHRFLPCPCHVPIINNWVKREIWVQIKIFELRDSHLTLNHVPGIEVCGELNTFDRLIGVRHGNFFSNRSKELISE